MPRNSRVQNHPAEVTENHFVIVCYGKPAAKGKLGDVICCIEERESERDGVKLPVIGHIGVYSIDGKEHRPDVWYGFDGEEVIPDEES